MSAVNSPRQWLDSEGRFLFGKHAGEYVESDSVPASYLE